MPIHQERGSTRLILSPASSMNDRVGAGPPPQALLHQRVGAQALRAGLGPPAGPLAPGGEGVDQKGAPSGHRPAPGPGQTLAAHRPGQPQAVPLRDQGAQQGAPSGAQGPGLVQPPAVLRADRLQPHPGPLLLQGEGPAPLHLKLCHGCPPSPRLLLTAYAAAGTNSAGGEKRTKIRPIPLTKRGEVRTLVLNCSVTGT